MPPRPNILILIAHDLGRHLHCYGVPTVQSPHLDRLAAEGARLANAFCTAPQCSPSRASITTGRYPHSNGVMGLTHANFAWDLHDDEVHLAATLKDAGYRTAVGGVMHETRRPHDAIGFREKLGGSTKAAHLLPAAAKWIEDHAREQSGAPFYLQLGVPEVHRMGPQDYYGHPPDAELGITVPPYLIDDHPTRDEFSLFQGAVRAFDAAVGELLAGLERAGVARDTIILVAADHGIPFPRAKCSLYDPGLEVTTLLRYPAAGFSGQVLTPLISNIDYLPTLLDLAGLPISQRVQGRSFAPLLRGEAYQEADAIFGQMSHHDYCDPCRCIRTRTHKLICNFSSAPSFMDPSQMWRPRTSPRVPLNPACAYHPAVELYDLTVDPLEFTNLAYEPAHAEVAGDLLTRLHSFLQETRDPILQGIPTPPNHRVAMTSLQTGKPRFLPENG